jgi:hypothetical protein
VSDIDTAAADSLKVLDHNRPIREADIVKAADNSLRGKVAYLVVVRGGRSEILG